MSALDARKRTQGSSEFPHHDGGSDHGLHLLISSLLSICFAVLWSEGTLQLRSGRDVRQFRSGRAATATLRRGSQRLAPTDIKGEQRGCQGNDRRREESLLRLCSNALTIESTRSLLLITVHWQLLVVTRTYAQQQHVPFLQPPPLRMTSTPQAGFVPEWSPLPLSTISTATTAQSILDILAGSSNSSAATGTPSTTDSAPSTPESDSEASSAFATATGSACAAASSPLTDTTQLGPLQQQRQKQEQRPALEVTSSSSSGTSQSACLIFDFTRPRSIALFRSSTADSVAVRYGRPQNQCILAPPRRHKVRDDAA